MKNLLKEYKKICKHYFNSDAAVPRSMRCEGNHESNEIAKYIYDSTKNPGHRHTNSSNHVPRRKRPEWIGRK